MFDGFTLSMIDLGDVTVRVRHSGSGPPLLLLHGHPQTHMIWHAIAPRLARDFTVITPDLRGEAIDGNHYFTEQTPEATYKALHEFFIK